MKIALIGASGRVGSRLLAELLRRGHSVTGIARDVTRIPAAPNLSVQAADVNDASQLAPLLVGHDAVVSATRFVSSDPMALIDAVKKAGVKRLLVVGGAGSLEVAPGKALADMPDFPAPYKAEADAGRAFLNVLKSERGLDWTFLSPSAEFAPGARTGKYRLGNEQLISDASGRSWISMEDYAIAMVDEIEAPKHSQQRFTVGY